MVFHQASQWSPARILGVAEVLLECERRGGEDSGMWLTHRCFDLPHAGHIESRSLGARKATYCRWGHLLPKASVRRDLPFALTQVTTSNRLPTKP